MLFLEIKSIILTSFALECEHFLISLDLYDDKGVWAKSWSLRNTRHFSPFTGQQLIHSWVDRLMDNKRSLLMAAWSHGEQSHEPGVIVSAFLFLNDGPLEPTSCVCGGQTLSWLCLLKDSTWTEETEAAPPLAVITCHPANGSQVTRARETWESHRVDSECAWMPAHQQHACQSCDRSPASSEHIWLHCDDLDRQKAWKHTWDYFSIISFMIVN